MTQILLRNSTYNHLYGDKRKGSANYGPPCITVYRQSTQVCRLVNHAVRVTLLLRQWPTLLSQKQWIFCWPLRQPICERLLFLLWQIRRSRLQVENDFPVCLSKIAKNNRDFFRSETIA